VQGKTTLSCTEFFLVKTTEPRTSARGLFSFNRSPGARPLRIPVANKATIDKMREHIQRICAHHDIVISWCSRPSKAWGSRDIQEICIAPIKSLISYTTALHELGHILGQHQDSRDVAVRERWAWQWARKNALIWTSEWHKRRSPAVPSPIRPAL
jgi:hypothetical protein